MAGFKNIGIKEYFKRYGYKYGLVRGAFMAMPLHWIKDKENRKILYYYKAKAFLKPGDLTRLPRTNLAPMLRKLAKASPSKVSLTGITKPKSPMRN